MHARSFGLALSLAASTAAADPPHVVTQACLGDVDTFLTCPPGATRRGTECRAHGGHWSGSSRQGPALFQRGNRSVSFAAFYKDHKKTGRVFRFDDEGRLESWGDYDADVDHGLSVTCTPDGRVSYVASYAHGKSAGISRSWGHRDGSFSYAFAYDADGHGHPVTLTSDQMRRPDELCQPKVCDVTAAPDLSGIPPALR